MGFIGTLGYRLIVSDAMTKYKFVGRPDWMFFNWMPFRKLRFVLVRAFRRKWKNKPGNRAVVRNTRMFKLASGDFVCDRLTYNYIHTHLKEYDLSK